MKGKNTEQRIYNKMLSNININRQFTHHFCLYCIDGPVVCSTDTALAQVKRNCPMILLIALSVCAQDYQEHVNNEIFH